MGLREGNTFPTISSQLLISELAVHFTKKENLIEKPSLGDGAIPPGNRVVARELREGTVLVTQSNALLPGPLSPRCAQDGHPSSILTKSCPLQRGPLPVHPELSPETCRPARVCTSLCRVCLLF